VNKFFLPNRDQPLVESSTIKNSQRALALSLTVLGAVARLLPHPPNFVPAGAMSLFAGARLSAWQAYLIPLALMALTDPILAITSNRLPSIRW
jgi:hypothetical protein